MARKPRWAGTKPPGAEGAAVAIVAGESERLSFLVVAVDATGLFVAVSQPASLRRDELERQRWARGGAYATGDRGGGWLRLSLLPANTDATWTLRPQRPSVSRRLSEKRKRSRPGTVRRDSNSRWATVKRWWSRFLVLGCGYLSGDSRMAGRGGKASVNRLLWLFFFFFFCPKQNKDYLKNFIRRIWLGLRWKEAHCVMWQ
jgi:hypothetical protein